MNNISEICVRAGFNEEGTNSFILALQENKDIENELLYYLENKDFLCNTKVNGLTIVDIMIWQIDHFRARLDRDTSLTRNNPDAMLLLAAQTMMDLRKNPEKILQSFESETGTDRII